GAIRQYPAAPLHTGGVAARHVGPRDAARVPPSVLTWNPSFVDEQLAKLPGASFPQDDPRDSWPGRLRSMQITPCAPLLAPSFRLLSRAAWLARAFSAARWRSADNRPSGGRSSRRPWPRPRRRSC